MWPGAKEAELAIYQPILQQWQAEIAKARPKARIADYLTKPADTIVAAKGDIAKSNLDLGIVDKLGDRLAFNKRVAEIAGAPSGKPEGTFNKIKLADFVAANPLPTGGDSIGVITIAGEIIDGQAGPGKAAGDTISALLLKGLADKNLKALVVRVDSPGGSALAAEQIRQAILQ